MKFFKTAAIFVLPLILAGCTFFGSGDVPQPQDQEQQEHQQETAGRRTAGQADAQPVTQETPTQTLPPEEPEYPDEVPDEHMAIALVLLELLLPTINELIPLVQAGMDAGEIADYVAQGQAREPHPFRQGGILQGIGADIGELVEMMVNAGFIVQFGLDDVFILNQKLEDHSLLDTIMLEAPRFIDNQLGTVPVIAGDDRLARWGGGIISRSNNSANPPITIYYTHAGGMTALEAVVWSIERDFQAGAFMPGAQLGLGTVRSSYTFDMATGYFREDLGLGMWRYWIYAAQEIRGREDVVILEIVVSPFHWNERQWGEREQALLAELSRHINVDLKRFAP